MAAYPANIDLSALDGEDGAILSGVAIRSVSAGDINDDGHTDLLVGGWGGSAYVVFGGGSLAGSTNLAALDGTNGFRIDGAAGPGWSRVDVAGLGDVNDDGIEDYGVVAGYARSHGPRGDAYVLYGQAGPSPGVLDLTGLDPAAGDILHGVPASDSTRRHLIGSIAAAGDVNGDGVDDILVGAAGHTHAGAVYLVFGVAGGLSDTLDIKTLDGTNGFRIDGAGRTYLGAAISSADVNGDGYSDLLMGSERNSSGGLSYVVFGGPGGFAPTLNVSQLSGTNGFRIVGATGDRSGVSLSDAGDVNGDGMHDILIGTEGKDGAQAAYVVFGKAGAGPATIDLATLAAQDGFQVTGARLREVSSAGDFNGDGFADLLVGTSKGAWVIFGGNQGDVALAAVDGSNGIKLTLPTRTPGLVPSLSAAGDVNGDGLADIIVGAGDTAYVVYGRLPGEAVSRTGTDAAQTIHGGAFDDFILGLGGDDHILGHEGADKLIGNAGQDTVDGGAGDDVLIGGFGGDLLIGGTGADIFAYRTLDGSLPGAANHDLIVDFGRAEGDRIDLSKIDADTGQSGNQAFHLGGAAFTGAAGELIQYSDGQGHTMVEADVNGDGVADFQLALDGSIVLTAADFIL